MWKVGDRVDKLTFWGNPGREYATVGDTLRVFPDRTSPIRPVAGKTYTGKISAVKEGVLHGHVRGQYLFMRVEAEWSPAPPPSGKEKADKVIRLLRDYPALYSAEQAERMWNKAFEG